MNAPAKISELAFSAPYKPFRAAVEAAARIASQRSTQPIMECVLITARDGMLTIEASDTVEAVRTSVEANVEAEGVAAVPARELKTFCASAKGDCFTVAFHGSRFSIRCGGAFASLMDQPPKTYPAWTFDVEEKDVDGETLSTALTFCAAGVNTSDLFPVQNGVCIHPKGLAGFDGKRMHVAEMETGFNETIVASRHVAALASALAEDGARFGVSDAKWQVTAGQKTLAGRTVSGDWPVHLIDLLSPGDLTAVVEHGDVLSAIKVATLGMAQAAKFEFSDGRLSISSQLEKKAGPYVGSASSEIEVSGGIAFTINVNPSHVEAAIRSLPEYPVAIYHTPEEGRNGARIAISPDQESLTCRLVAYTSEMRR